MLLQAQVHHSRSASFAAPASPIGVLGQFMGRPFVSEAIVTVMDTLAKLDLWRIELCFYTAALATLGFGLYIVLNTFAANARIFSSCQVGRRNDFTGGQVLNDVMQRPDYSTFYPGMLCSTVLMGMILLFPVLLSVFVAGTNWKFWQWLWRLLAPMILYLGATLIITLLFLRYFLLDWYCMKDGMIVRPRTFSCVWAVLTLVNFPLGVFGAIQRALFILPQTFIKFHQLDKSLLDEEHVSNDFGTATFLATVGIQYEELNPVRRAFVADVMPGAHRLYGPIPKLKPEFEVGRPNRKTWRNKWWLLKLLLENPSLVKYRHHQVSKDVETAEACSLQAHAFILDARSAKKV
jgi:hypothetical protein